METVISEQSAKEQLQIFLDYYDIDSSILPDDQRKAVDASEAKVVRGLMRGRLEIAEGEDGAVKVVQYVGKDKQQLAYAELSGEHKVEMKKAGDNAAHERAYLLLGAMTGVGLAGIKKLKGADLGLAESLGALFMQV